MIAGSCALLSKNKPITRASNKMVHELACLLSAIDCFLISLWCAAIKFIFVRDGVYRVAKQYHVFYYSVLLNYWRKRFSVILQTFSAN